MMKLSNDFLTKLTDKLKREGGNLTKQTFLKFNKIRNPHLCNTGILTGLKSYVKSSGGCKDTKQF
jgi:hypothetical protein